MAFLTFWKINGEICVSRLTRLCSGDTYSVSFDEGVGVVYTNLVN